MNCTNISRTVFSVPLFREPFVWRKRRALANPSRTMIPKARARGRTKNWQEKLLNGMKIMRSSMQGYLFLFVLYGIRKRTAIIDSSTKNKRKEKRADRK